MTYGELRPGHLLHGYFVVDVEHKHTSPTLSFVKITFLYRGRFKQFERWSTTYIDDIDTDFNSRFP